jgi:hypothetical protein
MSMDAVRYRTNLSVSSQLAPTVVVSSGGELSRKHLEPSSRLQPLASDTLELSKKTTTTPATVPSLLQRLGKAFNGK